MHWRGQSAGLLLLLFVLPSAALAQVSPARPLDPVTGIVEAFKTHDVVALGEGAHGNEQGAAFRNRLYRDPRFLAVVNDIVVESGNGRHQAMMDRYIAGEDIPEKELRLAWTETTQPHDVWDRDVFSDMFRTIREINRTLPKDKQLRVLLGDTPFTYDPANPGAPMYRVDSFTADLILREVIAKKRKALTVYGDMHHLRREPQLPPLPGEAVRPPQGTIVNLLEKAGVKVFSIWTFIMIPGGLELPALQPDIARWPNPSLAVISDTPLGVAPFTFYYPKGAGRMGRRGPNGIETFDLGEMIGGTMQEQYNAILYMGRRGGITVAGLSASLCADPDYVEMRVKRMSANMPPPPGGGTAPASPADAFRQRCKGALERSRTVATPGLEAQARRIIDGLAKGEAMTDILAPGLAQTIRNQRDTLMQRAVRSGPLQSLTFLGVGPNGGDIYRATFANNFSTATIVAGPDGMITGFVFGSQLQTPEQRAATFRATDRDNDGRLDRAEYSALVAIYGQAARLDNFFAQLDADQDGLVTPKEFETDPI